ncbi:molecular chaperone [Serratia sp. S1B]|nr:molecular chaperone [Serratia sp. S1B]
MSWHQAVGYAVRSRRYLCVGILLLLGGEQAWAGNTNERQGITLQSTRVIYPANETKGITFAVTNDTQAVYLVQSRVEAWPTSLAEPVDASSEVKAVSPFIVLPPLTRLESRDTLTLRIRLIEKTLPTDRESVFAFQVKAIPNQSEHGKQAESHSTGQARIILAIQNTLKLFYRPEGLPPYDVNQVAQALQFQRQGTQLVVTNPTAFYATFDELSVAGKPITAEALFSMVPPLGQQAYPLPNAVSSGEVRWRLLDDYGVKTESVTRTLNNSR